MGSLEAASICQPWAVTLPEEEASLTVTMSFGGQKKGEAVAARALRGMAPVEEPCSWGEASRRPGSARTHSRPSTSVRAPVSPPSMAQAQGAGGRGLGTSAVVSPPCLHLREGRQPGRVGHGPWP